MSSAQKKTLERSPSTGCRWARFNDSAATRYEALRRAFLISGWQGMNEVRFIALGFVGLLLSQPATDYVVNVYAAPVRRWWGRIDPKEHALLEVFRLLSAQAPLRLSDPGGHLDERRVVCPCLD
ncbi:MAG: hypothetical protein ACREV3_08365 [Gammaproteobacteria bacterium]